MPCILDSPLASTPFDLRATTVPAARSSEELQPDQRAERIKGWVDFVRQNASGESAKLAAERIYTILADEFPQRRYDTNVTQSLLEAQLLAGIREKRSVLLAYVERHQCTDGLGSWTIHLVEIAGVGARIDDMAASIHTPEAGLFRTRGLKQPLRIEPFGTCRHTWSCLISPWQGGVLTLCYMGLSNGERARAVSVRCPRQYLQ